MLHTEQLLCLTFVLVNYIIVVMSRGNWIPTPDVTEQTGGEIMMGHIGLPVGLDPERIEWNVDALRRGVIGWGGFQAVALAAYRGDEDRYAIGGGVDQSGVGVVTGAATVSRAESSSSLPFSDAFLNSRDIRNGVLGVGWNINALNSRIETHEQFNPAARAKQLNGAVKRAAISGVWSHNVTDVIRDKSAFINAIDVGVDAMFATNVTLNLLNHDYPSAAEAIAIRVAITGVLRGIRSLGYGVGVGDNITDVLLLSARPTRAAMGAGSLATNRLVRAA